MENDTILLKALIDAIEYANHDAMNSDEFSLMVMQWTDAVRKMHIGLEPIPTGWIEEYKGA